MKRQLRGLGRLLRVLGVVTAATWNIAIRKPEGEKLIAAQEKFYNDIKNILGITVVFNEAAAKVEKTRPTWYVFNHTSYGDFIVAGAGLRGTFAGKGEILTWPLVRHLAKAAKYIGLRRDKGSNPQSQAKIIKNFNTGNNTMMFPEATIPGNEPDRNVVIGDEVYRFHANLPSILFGQAGKDKEGNEVKLNPETFENICVQAVAIKAIEVEGKTGAHEDRELRKAYTAHDKTSMASQFWRLLTTESMTVELTPSPILLAKDFADSAEMGDEKEREIASRALFNEAHRQIASVIAPNQKEAYFAFIPSQDPAKRKPAVPITAPHVPKPRTPDPAPQV